MQFGLRTNDDILRQRYWWIGVPVRLAELHMKQNMSLDRGMPTNAPEQVRDLLAVTIPAVRDIDLSQTWTDEFSWRATIAVELSVARDCY